MARNLKTNPLVLGINGILYVHQVRFLQYLQGIWLIGHVIPSGKHTENYWKLPFIVSFPINNGDVFHSYVSLPEGILIHRMRIFPSLVGSNPVVDAPWVTLQVHGGSQSSPQRCHGFRFAMEKCTSKYHGWLVVWNMFYSSIYWE